MKLRYKINNNKNEYAAIVEEDDKKIFVTKYNTSNYWDFSDAEKFVFETITDFENWINCQNWIDKKKIKKICNFKKVKII